MRNGMRPAACAMALILCACGQAPDTGTADTDAASAPVAQEDARAESVDADTAGDAAATDTAPDDTAQAPAGAALQDAKGNPIALLPFDIEGVPASSATLGELPFFSLPDGYAPINKPDVRAFARFPFRLGDGLHWVEGASWNGNVGIERGARRDKEFSARELRRNLEAVLEQAGAKKVFEGPLNRDLYYGPQLADEIGSGFIDGVNMNGDASVHVIRLADRNIWVQLTTDTHKGGLVIVEERPFAASARWTDAFPYLSMPAGYDKGNRPRQRDFDMYPFWTGDGFEEVEGRTWARQVRGQGEAFSMHEVRRNLEAMMAEAGGTRLFDGRIPKDASDRYDSEAKAPYSDGTGYSWNGYDSLVYRVDRPQGQVWVHARLESTGAGWVVVEREGFRQSAALLPVDALKQQLDADGRVAIEVNFAVDKAGILPESQPQIEQVLALLQADPSLQLSIEGHTDDTGTADHNRTLSQARARSVVDALTGKGIDAARLSATGFGQDRPVADNGTAEGKARNRRVELVKR